MYVDVGNAGDLLNLVSHAIMQHTTFPIILDMPRTLQVIHTSHSQSEIKLMTKDTTSGEFITIYVPRDAHDRAQADLPSIPLSA